MGNFCWTQGEHIDGVDPGVMMRVNTELMRFNGQITIAEYVRALNPGGERQTNVKKFLREKWLPEKITIEEFRNDYLIPYLISWKKLEYEN